jgi:aryl-alcohol dehydrogenase-like predicted oxidoreductase
MRLAGREAFAARATRTPAESIGVLRRAIDLGVNHIDTASFYFSSAVRSNDLIREALWPYPDDLLIATKVGPSRAADGGWQDRARPSELRSQVEENLRQLGRDHLDLVYYRCSRGESIAEYVTALAEMQRNGLVKHVGVSGVTSEQLAQAQSVVAIAAVQNRFGIEYQQSKTFELIEKCAQQKIAFVPFFTVTGPGVSRGHDGTGPESLRNIAQAHGLSVAQAKIAWTLNVGPHVLAIPGTGNIEHLEANIAAGAVAFTPDEMRRLSL